MPEKAVTQYEKTVFVNFLCNETSKICLLNALEINSVQVLASKEKSIVSGRAKKSYGMTATPTFVLIRVVQAVSRKGAREIRAD